MEMEAPNFWDDPEKSQGMMKELKSLKDDMQTYQNLISQKEDMETLIEMGYEENDDSVIPEIEELLEEFKKDFENIRVKTLLSGEYDKNDAIVTLHAGAGGDRVLRLGRYAVPHVHPLGRAQGLCSGGSGLSGRRGGRYQICDF